LKRIYKIIQKSTNHTDLRRKWNELQCLLQDRFQISLPTLSLSDDDPEKLKDDDSEMASLNDDDLNEWDNDNNLQPLSLNDGDDKDMSSDELEDADENLLSFCTSKQQKETIMREYMEDDDEQPVIVSMEEYELSMTRIQTFDQRDYIDKEQEQKYSKMYPFLFAAQQQNHEDIVMACARIIEDGSDDLLIREATAYLNDVEANRF